MHPFSKDRAVYR